VVLGNSKAQEAAAKANPPPFNPALLGGSLGAILLGFGIFSNRGSSADSQISSSKTGGSAETSSGPASSGVAPDVANRKKEAQSWIADWEKRTKK